MIVKRFLEAKHFKTYKEYEQVKNRLNRQVVFIEDYEIDGQNLFVQINNQLRPLFKKSNQNLITKVNLEYLTVQNNKAQTKFPILGEPIEIGLVEEKNNEKVIVEDRIDYQINNNQVTFITSIPDDSQILIIYEYLIDLKALDKFSQTIY